MNARLTRSINCWPILKSKLYWHPFSKEIANQNDNTLTPLGFLDHRLHPSSFDILIEQRIRYQNHGRISNFRILSGGKHTRNQ